MPRCCGCHREPPAARGGHPRPSVDTHAAPRWGICEALWTSTLPVDNSGCSSGSPPTFILHQLADCQEAPMSTIQVDLDGLALLAARLAGVRARLAADAGRDLAGRCPDALVSAALQDVQQDWSRKR